MDLQVPPSRLAQIEPGLRGMGPWMHPFRLGQDTLVGRFKYHAIEETVTTSESPRADRERHQAAYAAYLEGRPFWLIDEAFRRMGGIDGATVLDIASATGKYSLRAAELGADVLGVEIRPEQVAQAKLIGELAGSQAAFRHESTSADDPSFLAGERFDVVLSLGLLYHLVDPVAHLRNLARLAGRAVVINTLTHWGEPGTWKLGFEDPKGITKGTEGQSWIPHYAQVPDLLRMLGFSRVESIVHPLLADIQQPLLDVIGQRRRRRVLVSELASRRMRKSTDRLLRVDQNPGYFTYLATF